MSTYADVELVVVASFGEPLLTEDLDAARDTILDLGEVKADEEPPAPGMYL